MLQFKRNLLDIQEHLYQNLVPKVGSILNPLYNYITLTGVKANGDAYINTEIIPDSTTIVELNIIPSEDAQILGNSVFGIFIEDGVYKCVYGTATYSSDIQVTSETTSLELSKQGFKINNILIAGPFEEEINSTEPILLGGRYVNESYDASGIKTISSCKITITTSDNLKDIARNYIATQQKTNYICGLFDIANREFKVSELNNFKYVSGNKPYTRLDYIQATGTQYLKNITLSSNYSITFDIAPGYTTEYYNLFDNYLASPMMWVDETMRLETNATYTNKQTLTADTRYKITNNNISGNHTYINNELVYDYPVVSGSSFNVTLLHRSQAQCFKGKIYRIKVFSGNIKQIDLIPVKLNETGKIGLWDLVSNTFYDNMGTGTFIGGSEIPDIEHYELEYLQCTGTQYIDTGVIASKNMSFELKFSQSSHSGAVFGAWNNNTDRTLFLSIHAASNYYDYYCYNTAYSSYANYGLTANNENIIATFDGGSINLYDFNKTLLKGKSASYPDFTTGINFHLFAIKYPNSVDIAQSGLKIYYCKIWNNGILVRDLIPVKIGSDNTVCMYDLVNDEYYTNAGSGEFVGGGEV